MVRWVLDLVDVIWLGFFGAWFVVFVAEQILYARGRPGSGLGPPGDGGWCFVKGGAADLAGLDDRRGRWTVRDQLRIEIRSPLVWAIWAMVLGNGVAGVALADTGALWAGTLFAIVYGWMLWNHLKLVNRARVCELPVLTLRGPTFFRGGTATVRDPVTDKKFSVVVPWRASQSLMDRHGALEIMVVADEKSGIGVALRPAPTSGCD